MEQVVTHTPVQLAALPPRELDALAYFYVLGRGVVGMRDGEPVVIPMLEYDGPRFSTDLNAAALLEAELARRGLDVCRAEILSELVDGEPIEWPEYRDQFAKVDYAALSRNQCASAKQRTIAAILAAQEEVPTPATH